MKNFQIVLFDTEMSCQPLSAFLFFLYECVWGLIPLQGMQLTHSKTKVGVCNWNYVTTDAIIPLVIYVIFSTLIELLFNPN